MKFIHHVKTRVLAGLNIREVLRDYAILLGAVILVLLIGAKTGNYLFAEYFQNPLTGTFFGLYLLISFLLYPLACMWFRSVVNFFLGGFTIVGTFLFWAIVAVVQIPLLFIFAIFLGPLGLVSSYLRGRSRLKQVEPKDVYESREDR